MNINTDQLAQQCVEAINGKIKNLKKFESKTLKSKEKLDFEKVLKSDKKYENKNSLNKLFQKRRIKKECNKKKYGEIGQRIVRAMGESSI